MWKIIWYTVAAMLCCLLLWTGYVTAFGNDPVNDPAPKKRVFVQ